MENGSKKRILKKLFLLVGSFSLFLVQTVFASSVDFTHTPVQVLDISKTELSITEAMHDSMYVSLLNQNDSSLHVSLQIVDSLSTIGSKTSKRLESIKNVTFDYPREIQVPAKSIVRFPVYAHGGDISSSFNFKGGLVVKTLDIDQTSNLTMNVIQPFKLNVTYNSVKDVSSYQTSHIYILCILFFIPILFFVLERIFLEHHHASLLVGAFILFFGVYYNFYVQDLGIIFQNLTTNLLDEKNGTVDVDLLGDVETYIDEILDDYSYKGEDDSQSYVELNSVAQLSQGALTSVYEQDVDLLQIKSSASNSTSTVDTEAPSTGDRDIENSAGTAQVNSTSDLQHTSTNNVDLPSTPLVDYMVGATHDITIISINNVSEEDILSEEIIYELPGTNAVDLNGIEYGAIYSEFSGIEARIIKGQNPYYSGMKVVVNSLARELQGDIDLTSYYFSKAMQLSDGGVTRTYVRKMCSVLTNEKRHQNDEEIIATLALKLLSGNDIDPGSVSEFVQKLYSPEYGKYLKRFILLCDDFSLANNYAIDLMKRQRVLFDEFYINSKGELTYDLDDLYVEEEKATKQLDYYIEHTKIEDLKIKKEKLDEKRALLENLLTEKKLKLKDSVKEEDSFVDTLSIYDLEVLEKELKQSDDTDDAKKNSDDDGDQVEDEILEVDISLEDSEVVVVSIPNSITYPTLSRQDTEYTAESSLGEFSITTYNEKVKWKGFFSFSQITDEQSMSIEHMWLKIGEETIYPEIDVIGNQTYFYYPVSHKNYKKLHKRDFVFSPRLKMSVPANITPGEYTSDISFTLIQ